MLTRNAAEVWKYLDGIFCVYKPPMVDPKRVCGVIRSKLSDDLNDMECRPPREYVHITGDTTQNLNVEVRPNYADHPLLIGPRYVPRDIKLHFANILGTKMSGVNVVGIGRGVKEAYSLHESNNLSTYHVTGEFGLKTDNLFSDGNIQFRCNYKHVKKHNIDTAIAAIQSNHQRNLLSMTGVHPGSQEAYELASSGLIRPTSNKLPVIYSIKCLKMNLPYFVLEMVAVNENEDYLLHVVDEIGLRLKNFATTNSISCIRYSSFTVENALLQKHWTLQNILDNMKRCSHILEKNKDVNIHLRQVAVEEEKLHTEDFDELEEEVLDYENSEDPDSFHHLDQYESR